MTRDEFLKLTCSGTVDVLEVEIPGGVVYLRPLNCAEIEYFEAERIKWHKTLSSPESYPQSIRAVMLCMALCDEDGSPQYTRKDIPILGKMDNDVAMTIYKAALVQNKLASTDEVDEAEKN